MRLTSAMLNKHNLGEKEFTLDVGTITKLSEIITQFA